MFSRALHNVINKWNGGSKRLRQDWRTSIISMQRAYISNNNFTLDFYISVHRRRASSQGNQKSHICFPVTRNKKVSCHLKKTNFIFFYISNTSIKIQYFEVSDEKKSWGKNEARWEKPKLAAAGRAAVLIQRRGPDNITDLFCLRLIHICPTLMNSALDIVVWADTPQSCVCGIATVTHSSSKLQLMSRSDLVYACNSPKLQHSVTATRATNKITHQGLVS